MTDVLPADLIPAKVRECLSSHQMVLDLLLDEGIPVAFSEVELSAALLDPGQPAGRFLGLTQSTWASRAAPVALGWPGVLLPAAVRVGAMLDVLHDDRML